MDDTQTQTTIFTRLAAAYRRKQTGQNIVRQAWPGILDLQLEILPTVVQDLSVIHHLNLSPPGHCLDRVLDQVDQNLFDSVPVAIDFTGLIGDTRGNLH